MSDAAAGPFERIRRVALAAGLFVGLQAAAVGDELRERTFPAGPDDADMAPVSMSIQTQIIAMLSQFVAAAPPCKLRSREWADVLDGRIQSILKTRAGSLDAPREPTEAETAAGLGLALFWKTWASEPSRLSPGFCEVVRTSRAMRLADKLVNDTQTGIRR